MFELAMKPNKKAGVRHELDPEQVIAIIADINYSYVHLLNGSCLHRSRTLKWYLDRWPFLLRIHKNAIINPSLVHHYSLTGGKQPTGYVIMKNNLRLDVSRRNIKQVSQILSSLE